MIRPCTVLCLAAAWWLASCGGNGPAAAPRPTAASVAATLTAGRAAQPPERRTLAAAQAAEVDPTDAANQLFDYAQTYFPEVFPGKPPTSTLLGYIYRHYPATGIYLAVREGEVYVMGGGFGPDVTRVGVLTQFITPQPRVVSSLCASAGVAYGTFATPSPAVGRNAAATLASCSGSIASPRWRQTAGTPVALLSDRSQTVSFDPPQPGTYGFEVSFVDGTAGAGRSETITLSVAAADTAPVGLTVRASHSVRSGGAVSVRAWPTVPAGDSVKAVSWTQIDGPPVQLELSTSRLAVFVAPAVTRDTLIRLRATLYTENGRLASDEVMVLVEHHPQAPAERNAVWSHHHVSRVHPYLAAGPYSAVLQPCAYDAALFWDGPRENLCPLSRLPFLAQDSGGGIPSVEQVMSRVLVSHDWLGRNFETFLRTHDANGDLRRMLNSVTAIVLSTQVRPSIYMPLMGAIYLDAESFWLNAEERDTLNELPDYRSAFDDGLRFATLWRYVKDKRSVFAFYDPRERLTRTIDDVRYDVTRLLYHELTHALDFLPPVDYAGQVRSRSAWGNLRVRYNDYNQISDRVPFEFPLRAGELHALGEVLFRGATPTLEQRGYTPDQIAGFFAPDLAVDDYNYSTALEDVAMTMEELLMERRQGVRRDFAIVDAFDGASATGSTIVVRWGQRGRIGEPSIRPRAAAMARDLTPWLDPAELDRLPAPLMLRAGDSWTANLEQPAPPRRAGRGRTDPTRGVALPARAAADAGTPAS